MGGNYDRVRRGRTDRRGDRLQAGPEARAGLAVVGAFAGLIFGLRAAFIMEANQARTLAIFIALGEFGAGLVAALGFYAFREVIQLLLTIEENTRRD